jgi:hypothetical protein
VILHIFVTTLKKTGSEFEILHGRLPPENASRMLSTNLREVICRQLQFSIFFEDSELNHRTQKAVFPDTIDSLDLHAIIGGSKSMDPQIFSLTFQAFSFILHLLMEAFPFVFCHPLKPVNTCFEDSYAGFLSDFVENVGHRAF